jgi:hypothetical protein
VIDARVSPGKQEAIEAFCAHVVELAPRSFVLTGGGTAGDAYRLLASEGWRDRLPWHET